MSAARWFGGRLRYLIVLIWALLVAGLYARMAIRERGAALLKWAGRAVQTAPR